MGATPLVPKKYWKYLGFFFDRVLTFKHHVGQYTRKALSTVRSFPALGNLVRGVRPNHKRLLYRTCILPIATYGARLWNFTGALEHLRKMQWQACLWILGAFKTSPGGVIETRTGIPPIHLHLKKLVNRSHMRLHALSDRHVIHALVEGVGPLSMSAQLQHVLQAVRSPITEAWANQDLCTTNVTPFNGYNCPVTSMSWLYSACSTQD